MLSIARQLLAMYQRFLHLEIIGYSRSIIYFTARLIRLSHQRTAMLVEVLGFSVKSVLGGYKSVEWAV